MSQTGESIVVIPARSGIVFLSGAVLFVLIAALLAAVAPIGLIVMAVFLFAGPHNFLEARYFLTRLPSRPGKLKPFFVCSVTGILLLSAGYVAATSTAAWLNVSGPGRATAMGIWNSCFLLWIGLLAHLRRRQPPRREWAGLWPGLLILCGISWVSPPLLAVVLVYAHPITGICILDREVAQRRPEWHSPYRVATGLAVTMTVFLWVLPGSESQAAQFTATPLALVSSGAHFLPFLPADKLVATHAYLELLHYGVWILAIPLASGRLGVAAFRRLPVMHSAGARRLIRVATIFGVLAVAVLWFGFTVDYHTTRAIYFTVAIVHVLAEVPFLLRMI